jgi:L-threonine kinase
LALSSNGGTTNGASFSDENGAVLLGSATVRAPGVCGELAQGVIEGIHFLVTCPVDFYSRVKVEIFSDGPGVEAPEDCSKAAAAVRRTLSQLKKAKVRARLTVSNPIPRGKGMGSSSADLAAAIAATGLALDIRLSPLQIGQLALQVEPTDGVMFPGITLFDHRAGTLVEELGPPLPLEIVALDFGGSVDTLDFNRVDRRAQWQAVKSETGEALGLVREGLQRGDARLLGQGASLSAAAGQQVSFKPRLSDVTRFAGAVGAVGVNVAHSGAVIGVLLDATERRGKSVFRQAREAFPEAEAIHHFRLLSGGVQAV